MPVPKLSPICEVLHDRLVRLHRVLGIEPQVHFWPLPEDNHYGAQYALACWEFGRHYAHEEPVLVGNDPERLYREMETHLTRCLEQHVQEHQERIDTAVDGLKLLLREFD
jgi:hypothetical protein